MFVTHLNCLRCHAQYPFNPELLLCPTCGAGDHENDPGILDVQYDYDAASAFLEQESARNDMFRYLPLLPVEHEKCGLPTGGTPLVAVPRLAQRLGLRALYIKDETRNPTRCLKDRATAVCITMAQDMQRKELYCASAGNAAISLAGFCANLGLSCHAFVPNIASATRLAWLQRYGADVHVSSGNYDQAYQEAEEAGMRHGWYSRNCAFNPYLVEGKKTVALEIGEQMGWQAPDLVVAPVGDGCTLGAIGKGFRELRTIGRTSQLPRLIGVQSEAIQPLVRRSHGEAILNEDESQKTTQAASIAVHRPRNALRLLAEIEVSHGTMIAVSDEEIATAQHLLAIEAGVIAEFTSATTMAALLNMAVAQTLNGQTAVLVITGGRLDGEA